MGTRQKVLDLLRTLSLNSYSCPCHSSVRVSSSGGHASMQNVRSAKQDDFTCSREYAFEMASSNVRFGCGATQEIGFDLKDFGCSSICLVTDPHMVKMPPVARVVHSLAKSSLKYELFDQVSVEPTDVSLKEAIEFARRNHFDAFVAVGGGSTMDTAKAMNLYAGVPKAEFLDFVNAPIGRGNPVPRTAEIKPLIAVPTTAGTGSETTGVSIFDYTPLKAKTGIGSRVLRPTLGIIDPLNTATMPPSIAAASGFDVLCHALEAYTALPYTERTPRPSEPNLRPAYQGSNPISDVWCLETLKLISRSFVRSVQSKDPEAKKDMALAATYAGIGFGNAGVHLCHGLSYPISGLNKSYVHQGYEHIGSKIIPHGISVVLPAPAVFRFTGPSCPERHLEAARILGADVSNAKSSGEYAGRLLAERVYCLMDALGAPKSLREVGFSASDIPDLVKGALPQHRVTQLSPYGRPDEETLAGILEEAM